MVQLYIQLILKDEQVQPTLAQLKSQVDKLQNEKSILEAKLAEVINDRPGEN